MVKNGASLYVCGDEQNMAKDVHKAIHQVLVKEGNMSDEEAETYLTQMKKTNDIKETFIRKELIT